MQKHDIDDFRKAIVRKKNVLGGLLARAGKLVHARQVGLVYGTDASCGHFLPPAQWDRGVMDRFDGPGVSGRLLKYAGPLWVKWRNLSPVYLFDRDELGERVPARGIIAFILRNHRAFYEKGIRILLADQQPVPQDLTGEDGPQDPAGRLSIVSFDGDRFKPLTDIQIDTGILELFKADNFMAAYIPDYGAIVFNTVRREDLVRPGKGFLYGPPLKSCLTQLMAMIETASLVYLGKARGNAAARLIRRKETRLRQTASRLKKKEQQLKVQQAHLFSVGAVTTEQLDMSPVAVHDGVYAFADMVGSVRVSRQLRPRDYFFILNLCHEIAAEHAHRFGCRVDNIMGDAVFFQSLSVFDDSNEPAPGPWGRLMRMTCLLSSVLGEIHLLALGRHPLDRKQEARCLLETHGAALGFRAGMSQGRSLVGPLGSSKRKIVTAVGEMVDLASRLESTGLGHHIHTTAGIAAQLEEAWISEDTPRVFEFAGRVMADLPGWRDRKAFSFFEFYQAWRGVRPPLVRDPGPVRYKEFSDSRTCLIPCLKESGAIGTCAGI